MIIAITDFVLSANYNRPKNTVGVPYEFYFGTIDGIELGSPCDSYEEALDNLTALLNGSTSIPLRALLQEDVDWLMQRICELKRPDLIKDWQRQLTEKSTLLSKVIQYQMPK
ncbi:MAG: hypothetical protein CL578_05715 [Alteromonadaceae bacterium]|uniref:Uncharacterized protein n=1 Tax=Paraglaciecola agarilytica NO2 TaxID=1125747 RepID=A0ABQ0I1X5_9ALTE|nr:hypothetical protein [Paraglaciecola agarilytica]MBN24529.1 hypothetical protein [Alteromonadaceae bacterium]GAC03335.1 hypothetical protein GAGA_0470 [Paraglaciecola agarilytica NO2]|tara:strand:+ start:27295 stop:27630 length:336 start_codon:yes stop_codon:yes gene_type:complete